MMLNKGWKQGRTRPAKAQARPYSLGAMIVLLLVRFSQMKKFSLIFLSLIISFGTLANDDEELPPNREIIRSICIGVLHGGLCFGATLLLSLPFQLLLPAEAMPEDPYEGVVGTGAADFGRLVLGASQETAFWRIVLQPATRSLICRGLNHVSGNTQRNYHIARYSGNILTAICFGSIHLFNPNPSIFQVIYASLYGCFEGELCYRYGRIAAITSHITFNILGLLLMRASLANVKN